MFRRTRITVGKFVHNWNLAGHEAKVERSQAALNRINAGKSRDFDSDLKHAARLQQHQAALDAFNKKHGGRKF